MTFAEIGKKIEATQADLSGYISRLRGDDYDMAGLAELQELLGGGRDGEYTGHQI